MFIIIQELRVVIRVAVLLAKCVTGRVLAAPVKHVDSESNICKECIILYHPLQRAVIVKKDVLWLGPSAENILHEVLGSIGQDEQRPCSL